MATSKNKKKTTTSPHVKSALKILAPLQRDFAKHPFFTALRGTVLSDITLEALTTQYGLLSEGFPGILGLAIASLPTDLARRPLVKNLWEEHGDADGLTSAHRVMYKTFMAKVEVLLGRRKGSLSRGVATPHTLVYLAGMRGLAYQPTNPSAVVGLVAFCEAIARSQCNAIHMALQGRDPVAFGRHQPGSEFWIDHSLHDTRHLLEVLQIVDRLKKFDSSQFKIGAYQSMLLEQVFWDGLVATSQ